MFEEFMKDPGAWDMYITGPAGTGKTTNLREKVEWCITNEVPYVVCAYTHRACEILASKLPHGAAICTLHSFLKKRPTINQHATNVKQVENNSSAGSLKTRPKLMFIDEYSMIGEKDGVDILAAQDPEYDGESIMKVVWIGDPHQLPPVGDIAYVKPKGKYAVNLTVQYRNDNELQVPLNELIAMIEGGPMSPLTANERFVRGKDIVEEYHNNWSKYDEQDVLDQLNHIVLAYTNERVELLNQQIQGYKKPKQQDWLFSPSTKQQYKFLSEVKEPTYVDTPFSGEIHLDSKYQTLEHLIKSKLCKFAEVQDRDGNVVQVAYVFGHYQYKLVSDKLKAAAAKSNKDIEDAHRGYKAAAWAKANPKTRLARARAKAWRDFLCFDECAMCLDFDHAMTVHKSQGSTFDTVFLDTEDLYTAAAINPMMYLKLMYVAVSRAQYLVMTN